jgi:hypothetical protein
VPSLHCLEYASSTTQLQISIFTQIDKAHKDVDLHVALILATRRACSRVTPSVANTTVPESKMAKSCSQWQQHGRALGLCVAFHPTPAQDNAYVRLNAGLSKASEYRYFSQAVEDSSSGKQRTDFGVFGQLVSESQRRIRFRTGSSELRR